MQRNEELAQKEQATPDETVSAAGGSIREQKIKLKKMIQKQRKESEQAKIADFYREKPMDLSHIQLKKGVETEEKASSKGENNPQKI